MSKISERLKAYQTQMTIYTEQHKVILASDVLDMIEQLQDDLKDSIDKVVEALKKTSKPLGFGLMSDSRYIAESKAINIVRGWVE